MRWSDGKPFSAADVAFTFNLLKRYPALDTNSVWSALSSVKPAGNTVVMTFNSPAVTDFPLIAGQTPIVPEHIWSQVANPVVYLDQHPVGTGAYTVSPCTPQNITYKANPGYWQPGKPKIETINYPAFTSLSPSNKTILNGSAEWGGNPLPDIVKAYTATSPNHHYWFPPISNVSLFINQKDPVLSLPVRQAMAFAINRQQASTVGEFGYEPAANQTGVVTPTFTPWLDQAQASAYGYRYDPTHALAILTAAGYKRGADGIMAKGGQRLAFTLVNEGANADWDGDVKVIQANLAAVGIRVTVENLSYAGYGAALYNGNFQLAYGVENGGPSPFYELRQLLYSPLSAPIGKPAASNYERYSNPAADVLIQQYQTTTSISQQHAIADQLQNIMQLDVPVIPVTENVDWYEYNTRLFTGWPDPAHPYAQPAPYNFPDWGWVLLHLYPNVSARN
jgi:peptide/nickel transport system substrate-binding protein